MTSPAAQERVNTATHGFGMALSLVGAVFLISLAASSGDVWRVVGCSIYAFALVSVFTASTLSHAFTEPSRRRMFRILDQAIIYLLIVGTYTPFALAFLRTGWWLVFLLVMWVAALVGFFSKLFFAHRIDAVVVGIYVLLGWMPIVAAWPLVEIVPAAALWWMLIGGLCYTFGTYFLVVDHHGFYFHAIWHLCVVAGSTVHFFAILRFVALV